MREKWEDFREWDVFFIEMIIFLYNAEHNNKMEFLIYFSFWYFTVSTKTQMLSSL